MTPAPAHLILGPDDHGVSILARQLAAAVGAPTVKTWTDAALHPRVHVHLNGRLLVDSAREPVARLAELCRRSRTTVTLHDVPQPSDGAGFPQRVQLYRAVLARSHGCAVSSWHERELVREFLDPDAEAMVAPLPMLDPPPDPPDPPGPASRRGPQVTRPGGSTAAIFGFVYPGKGHHELIQAAAASRGEHPMTVVALGAPAPGHHDLVADLSRTARALDVPFVVTGHLSETDKWAALRDADVAVCGHRNVSASGSLNEWLAAGRRPLVRDGRYAREMESLRPGCHRLYADDDLCEVLLEAALAPELTWLPPGTSTRPDLADTADTYLHWWATR